LSSRSRLIFGWVIILALTPIAFSGTDRQLKTFRSPLYLEETKYFRTGSAVYFQSQGTTLASSPVLKVTLGGLEINVDLQETPPGSGIYRGVFYTSATETNDDEDTIRTYDGAVLILSSDIDGDGVEGTTDRTNITIDDTPPVRPRWCKVNGTNDGSIMVNWTAYSRKDFGYYTVFRSTSATFDDPVGVANVTDPSITYFVDPQSNLISHTRYWYGVIVTVPATGTE